LKNISKLLPVIVSVSIFLNISADNLRAQDNKNNIVKFSLTNLIWATPTLFYERTVGSKTSLQIGGYYSMTTYDGTHRRGIGVMPEFRFYPGKKGASRGFYLAPFLKYQNYDLYKDQIESGIPVRYEANSTGMGGGLLLGGQFLIGNLVVLDLYLGPSVVSWNTDYKDDASADIYTWADCDTGTSLLVRTGISIGVAF